MRNAACSGCGLGDYVRRIGGNVCVWGEQVNASPARLFVVGQNPGWEENREGRPFIGRSGDLVRGLLSESYFPYAISNAVKCHSEDNREPSNEEIEACRPFLIQEILDHRPQVILALGNPALKALTGRSGVMNHRGKPDELRADISGALEKRGWSKVDQPKVLSSVHPAYVLRVPSAKGLLVEDIQGAIRYCRQASGEEVAPDATWQDATFEDLGPALTFDIESTGLNYRASNFHLHMIGVHDGSSQVKILTRQEDIERFAREAVPQMGFNALAYDQPALSWKYKTPYRPVQDAMLLAFLLDETMFSHALQPCAIRWLGVTPWKDEVTWDWAKGPQTPKEWERAKQYNARDVLFTHQLWDKLWSLLDERNKLVYQHLLVPSVRSLVRIYETGLPVSLENLNLAKGEAEKEVERVLKIIQGIAEENWIFEFNPNSTRHVANLLFNKLKLKPVRFSAKTKKPSTDQETLKKLQEQEPGFEVCSALLTHRENQKVLSSYLYKYPGLIEGDGRLHPDYSVINTETGRTSSWIQQIPRKKSIRRMVAVRPGRKIVAVDQSQVELRLMAWRSREPTMLKMFKNKEDIHWTIALQVAQRETIHDTSLLALQYGLPTNGTGAEVLSILLGTEAQGILTDEELRARSQNQEDQDPWCRERWLAGWTLEPSLQRRLAELQKIPEGSVREVREYQMAIGSSPRPQSQEQRPFQLRDAVQALSSNRTFMLGQFPAWKERRSLAKAVSFGFLYGAEAFTFRAYIFKEYGLKVTVQEAEYFRDEIFFKTFSGLPPYYDSVIERLKKDKKVISPFGRVRHLENIDAGDIELRAAAARQAINTANQADASDITLIGLNLTLEAAPWLDPIMFFHDANLFEVDEDRAEEAAAIAVECMQHKALDYIEQHFGFTIDVPLVAEAEIVQEWG